MTSSWSRPGRSGAVLYAVAAVLFGTIAAGFSRLRFAEQQGRRRAARALPHGPIIIVSNHASYADGVLLALACRRMGRSIRLLATGGVFRVPVLGRMMRSLGFIRVERGSAAASGALDLAAEALAAGEAVGIFPEGRTTRDPHHWPERAKTGAVRLALRTGVAIVPIGMVGSHRVLDHHHLARSLVVSLVLRPKVMVSVGESIDVRAMTGGEEASPEQVRDIADDVMGRIVALVEELRQEIAGDPTGVTPAPAAPESPPRPSRRTRLRAKLRRR